MGLTIGFDATSARQGAGIGRATRELLRALAARADDNRYRLFSAVPGRVAGDLPALDGRFSLRSLPLPDRVLNIVWYRVGLPLPVQLALGSFDLFHSPDFTLPPILGTPGIVTVHDLAFLRVPECACPSLRAYLTRVVPRSVRRAGHVIAVSETTRHDVIELLDVAPERVTAIPWGVSPSFSPMPREAAQEAVRALGIPDPYLLSVGTLEPRKNYLRLLDAYARVRRRGLDHRLVIVGAPGWLYQPIFQRLDELSLRSHVTLLQPDDRSLPALYNAAAALVYPSLYEGFGFPPLEALACGLPVACSTAPALLEVVGDAAVTFEPTEVGEMAAVIERVLSDEELRRELQRRGPERAAAFTWQRTADQTVAVYRQVADG